MGANPAVIESNSKGAESRTMKTLVLISLLLAMTGVAFGQATPTATPTAAYDFPASPTLGQKVTGPGAQTFQWDGTKWIALGGPGSTFAPLVNPPNGVNNYAPINAPSFTGLTIASQMQVANTLSAPTANFGNTTISSGSVLMMAGSAALYFNGIAPGGTCAAGSAVTSISSTIIPTCSPVLTGQFLPLTGGTLSGPGNLTVNGTLTQNGNAQFGGGATIAFGLQVPNYISVNGPATFNGTTALNGTVTFPSGSTATTAGFNNVKAMGIGAAVSSTAGQMINILNSINGGTDIVLRNPSNGTSASTGINFSNDAGNSGWLAMSSSTYTAQGPGVPADNFQIGATGNGGINIATDYTNASLPPVYVWSGQYQTAIFRGQALVLPNTNYSQIQFGTYQQPTASILGYSNSGSLHLTAGAWWNGNAWAASGATPGSPSVATPVDISMYPTSSFYPQLDIQGASAVPITGGINWSLFGRFELDSSPVQGLVLSGYANRAGTGNSIAALTVGNSYMSATNWANLNISGASYPINNGAGWQSDCGAGSGLGLFQVIANHFYMNNHAGLGCNAGFAWTNIAGWSITGMTVNHIENNETMAVPSVSSGSLVEGSRDMFGWIIGVKGGETTLTFTEAFDAESNCTLTAVGRPNLWFEANQAPGQVTFACVIPWSGDPCPDDSWVEYHCFGHGNQAEQQEAIDRTNFGPNFKRNK